MSIINNGATPCQLKGGAGKKYKALFHTVSEGVAIVEVREEFNDPEINPLKQFKGQLLQVPVNRVIITRGVQEIMKGKI